MRLDRNRGEREETDARGSTTTEKEEGRRVTRARGIRAYGAPRLRDTVTVNSPLLHVPQTVARPRREEAFLEGFRRRRTCEKRDGEGGLGRRAVRFDLAVP